MDLQQKPESYQNDSKYEEWERVQQNNIKKQESLYDVKSSTNIMDDNEKTEKDLEESLLSKHTHNGINQERETETEVTTQPLETFIDNIRKLLPQFWLYVENPNGLEFMRMDQTTKLIKHHIRLDGDLSITGGGRRECGEGCACAWRAPAPPAPAPHPLRALDDTPPPLLRSNPLYTEEEEQEVVIVVVDSLEEGGEEGVEEDPAAPREPRRAPSTSSGYGSGGGSHGRVSPTLPKNEVELISSKDEGSQSTTDSDSPECTLSRSMKEDIRACLGGCRWEKDVSEVVEAAVKGSGGISAARARLHAALLALHEPLPRVPNRGPSLPYCGPGVRPGDVTMMPKTTGMSFLAASALFTLDGARGEALSRRLARGERRRRRCRAALAVLALLMLLAAVGAVELLLSRGQRMFGAVLR